MALPERVREEVTRPTHQPLQLHLPGRANKNTCLAMHEIVDESINLDGHCSVIT